MAHPLETVLAEADGFVLIGDSSRDRFPALSYHAYTQAGLRFYCVDLGGRTVARGPNKTGKVYPSMDALPDDHGDLAVLWLHPLQAKSGVEQAHAAGCTRVWFSFQTGHPDAVARATELGMEVVEIGRCPVYYLHDLPRACAAHRLAVKLSGTWKRPPQLDARGKRRELI